MDQTPHWTPRAEKRLISAMTYIALNFYPEYAVAFRNDVIETANGIPAIHWASRGFKGCLPLERL